MTVTGKILILAGLCFFIFCRPLYARASLEMTEDVPLYTTWTLCITSFDTSGLSPAKRIMGNLITRNMVDELSSLDARVRSPEETMYYTEYAWNQARLEAGQALKKKRDERDALFFSGDTEWNYKNKVKKIDNEIKTLEAKYELQESGFPLVAGNPNFALAQQNLSGTFPPVPMDGMEYSFCKEQKIDGFLTGTISEYYGRVYAAIRLYTLYSRSYVYEDFILFSVEDQQLAVSGLASRLKAVLSGIEPSAIIVKAEPEDALILLNNTYAGRGNSGERDHSPGTVDVEVFADDHRNKKFQVDLVSGELAEVFINLQPIMYEAFDLDTAGGLAASVYLGSTFMGKTPITLNIVPDQHEYITMENERGETISFVYNGSTPSATIALVPPKDNGKTLEDYRKSFYGAYGRFWITLPLAVIINGVATASVDAYNYSGNADTYDSAVTARNVAIGSIVVAGGFLVETLIRMGIYLYKSNSEDVTTIK